MFSSWFIRIYSVTVLLRAGKLVVKTLISLHGRSAGKQIYTFFVLNGAR